MNEFFNKYVDLAALVLTVLLPCAITFRLKRKAGRSIRAVPTYFLVFGPAGLLTFMFFHVFENSYHAVENSLNGTFVYNFRFYSLLLLGASMGYLGIRFLQASFDKCLQGDFQNRRYFLHLLAVLLLAVPLIPIIPIAYVPVFLCGASLAGFPFVRRKGPVPEAASDPGKKLEKRNFSILKHREETTQHAAARPAGDFQVY